CDPYRGRCCRQRLENNRAARPSCKAKPVPLEPEGNLRPTCLRRAQGFARKAATGIPGESRTASMAFASRRIGESGEETHGGSHPVREGEAMNLANGRLLLAMLVVSRTFFGDAEVANGDTAPERVTLIVHLPRSIGGATKVQVWERRQQL